MTISLMPRQMELLRFIGGFAEAHGRAPRHNEMRAGLGLVSKSGVTRLLNGLEERGAIRCVRDLQGHRTRIEALARTTIPRSPDGAPLMAVRGPWWEAA